MRESLALEPEDMARLGACRDLDFFHAFQGGDFDIGAERGLGSAFLLTSGAFLVAGIVALKLPETLGRELR